jgi:RNA polymerase sigma-70 factor (ECF subfamily)
MQALGNDPDVELYWGIRARDERALAELMVRYSDKVTILISRILGGWGTKADVEDVIQDLWWAIWADIGDFSPKRGSFRKWVYMKAKYLALDCRRKLCREFKAVIVDDVESLMNLLPMVSHSTEEAAERKFVMGKVIKVVGSLPSKDKAIFILRYFEEWHITEIAQHLNLTPKAVESRLYRIRKILREKLKEEIVVAALSETIRS